MAWYRFPDESHNEDGRHISYLASSDKYRHLDPTLFDHLTHVVRDARTIASLMPALDCAVAFDQSLCVSSVPVRARRTFRKAWLSSALDHLSGCDLVFADPDNGIIDDSDKRKGRAKFGKHIPVEEALALADGRCAVIYHHNTRRAGGHDAEVDYWIKEIGLPAIAIRARAFSPRTFFILNPDDQIKKRVQIFCEQWKVLKVSLHKL